MTSPKARIDIEKQNDALTSDRPEDGHANDRHTGFQGHERDQEQFPNTSLLQEAILVTVVSMAQLSTQAGVGGTLAILHIIGDDLSVSNNGGLSWLMAAYSLTVGAFILPSGRLGDVFGYKRMLLIGFSWFSLWTLIAGLSVYSNSTLFNFSRALQGIGPAICLPNGLAVLGSTYAPGTRKNMVFAIFGATAPCGSVLGAAFASLLAMAWWPWAFFVFALVLAATAVAGALIIPSAVDQPARLKRESQAHTVSSMFWELDILGSVVGVTALVLIDFAWNQAPVVGWPEPYVPVSLAFGIILMPVFFYVEAKVARAPLLPFDCLNYDIGMILLCVACGWSCFGIFLYYIWQFFILLRYASPILATAWYSTNAISGAGAAVITGLLLGRVGPPLAMVAALFAYVVGSVLIATAPIHQTYWANTFLCLLIIPFGMDISFPAATVILSDAVPKHHQGIGASLVNTVVNFSISLGLGFAGVVEVNVNNGGETPEDILKGYRGAWYMGIGLSGMGLVISIVYWLRHVRKSYKESA